MLTLGQAAKECGKTKSTLFEAIRSGRLSAVRNGKNEWQIEPPELFRVYPQKQTTELKSQESILETTLDIIETDTLISEPEFITETDLAHRWGIYPAIMGQRRIFEKNRVPPHYKQGMQTRYLLADVEAFEAENNIVPRIRQAS